MALNGQNIVHPTMEFVWLSEVIMENTFSVMWHRVVRYRRIASIFSVDCATSKEVQAYLLGLLSDNKIWIITHPRNVSHFL
jgi:hypothetical protein